MYENSLTFVNQISETTLEYGSSSEDQARSHKSRHYRDQRLHWNPVSHVDAGFMSPGMGEGWGYDKALKHDVTYDQKATSGKRKI